MTKSKSGRKGYTSAYNGWSVTQDVMAGAPNWKPEAGTDAEAIGEVLPAGLILTAGLACFCVLPRITPRGVAVSVLGWPHPQ